MLLSITSLEFETSAAQEYNNYWWSNSTFPSLSESIHVWEVSYMQSTLNISKKINHTYELCILAFPRIWNIIQVT